MNFTLGAVIILIFLFPYFSLRFGYFFAVKTRPTQQLSTLQEILLAIGFAFIIHAAIGGRLLMSRQWDIEPLLRLLDGSHFSDIYGVGMEHRPAENFATDLRNFGKYHIGLNIFLVFFGFLFQRVALMLQLDKKTDGLRIHSYWYAFFGSFDKFPIKKNKQKSGIPSRILFVDVLVNAGSENVTYSGYLNDYHVSGDKLERLILIDVIKKPFSPVNDSPEVKGTELLSDYFSIEADTIVNINLSVVEFLREKKVITENH